MRKYVNGKVTEPAEYQDNGKIYREYDNTKTEILSDDKYSVKLTER